MSDDKDLKELEDKSPELDTESIELKAKEIAEASVSKLKENLIESLGGSGDKNEWGWTGKDPVTGKPAPRDWSEAPAKIVEKAKAEALAEFERKQAEREAKAKEEAEHQTKSKQEAEQAKAEEEYARVSAEWRQLVNDGDLPDVDPKIKEKLKTVKYEDLTDEEKADKGLKTWNELRVLHADLSSQGKSPSLTYTLNKHWKKKPAGKDAPVFGNESDTTAAGGGDEEVAYTQEEIKQQRKKWFGW